MFNINNHKDAIKRFEEIAKQFAAKYPKYEDKDKSLKAIKGFFVKYWNCADNNLSRYTGFSKPKEYNAFMSKIESCKEACPIMFCNDKDMKPCISVLKIVSAENNDVPPIKSRTGKLVQPFKLDIAGKIIKEVKPKIIKSWSIEIYIEVILQTIYFNNILSCEEDFDIIAERNIILTNIKRAEKRIAAGIPANATSSQYIRIVSVPMGGMNKRR